MSSIDLTNHFLIAMPAMADPSFSRTLTYICEHNEQGALGVVVNRPIDMDLRSLFERLSLPLGDTRTGDAPIWFGGPVQTDRGFVLHAPVGQWQSTLKVCDAVGLTTSKDILEAVGRDQGPRRLLVTLGYAGWSAGQLEHELTQNAWLTVEAKDPRVLDEILFELPADERLQAALHLLGVDLAMLSEDAGHA
ncbi:MAG: YqgE/AlgH family protein [Betaproteobacteria bacterium]|jgi:putative transcriptional regulator|nr:YqgE/AlgH family protein [Betaproteobacteria bacterium]